IPGPLVYGGALHSISGIFNSSNGTKSVAVNNEDSLIGANYYIKLWDHEKNIFYAVNLRNRGVGNNTEHIIYKYKLKQGLDNEETPVTEPAYDKYKKSGCFISILSPVPAAVMGSIDCPPKRALINYESANKKYDITSYSSDDPAETKEALLNEIKSILEEVQSANPELTEALDYLNNKIIPSFCPAGASIAADHNNAGDSLVETGSTDNVGPTDNNGSEQVSGITGLDDINSEAVCSGCNPGQALKLKSFDFCNPPEDFQIIDIPQNTIEIPCEHDLFFTSWEYYGGVPFSPPQKEVLINVVYNEKFTDLINQLALLYGAPYKNITLKIAPNITYLAAALGNGKMLVSNNLLNTLINKPYLGDDLIYETLIHEMSHLRNDAQVIGMKLLYWHEGITTFITKTLFPSTSYQLQRRAIVESVNVNIPNGFNKKNTIEYTARAMIVKELETEYPGFIKALRKAVYSVVEYYKGSSSVNDIFSSPNQFLYNYVKYYMREQGDEDKFPQLIEKYPMLAPLFYRNSLQASYEYGNCTIDTSLIDGKHNLKIADIKPLKDVRLGDEVIVENVTYNEYQELEGQFRSIDLSNNSIVALTRFEYTDENGERIIQYTPNIRNEKYKSPYITDFQSVPEGLDINSEHLIDLKAFTVNTAFGRLDEKQTDELSRHFTAEEIDVLFVNTGRKGVYLQVFDELPPGKDTAYYKKSVSDNFSCLLNINTQSDYRLDILARIIDDVLNNEKRYLLKGHSIKSEYMRF
ncbi:MAG: hypothetical protein ABIH39_06845, partial [Candidatus Margulisiibacteriota bacterium]